MLAMTMNIMQQAWGPHEAIPCNCRPKISVKYEMCHKKYYILIALNMSVMKQGPHNEFPYNVGRKLV